MTSLPPICLLAGGLGSRLGDLTRTIPKALIDIDGAPFVLHQLEDLSHQGVDSVVLCVGHLGELIEEAVGSSQFGIRIAYSYDGPGRDGTLGAIRRAQHQLEDRFLVLYGDTLLTLDYGRAVGEWAKSGAPAFMCVLRNDGMWGPSNARVEGGFVTAYDKRSPSSDMEWIDYGMSGLSKDLLALEPEASDLAELWTVLAAGGKLAAFAVTERFYEIGTLEALEETRDHLVAVREARAATIGENP